MTSAQAEARRRAEIMLAFSEGAEIQFKRFGASDTWRDFGTNPINEPSWNWTHYDWRIKPQHREPRVIYANEYGNTGKEFGLPKMSREEAIERGPVTNLVATRKFIEVIEEGES